MAKLIEHIFVLWTVYNWSDLIHLLSDLLTSFSQDLILVSQPRGSHGTLSLMVEDLFHLSQPPIPVFIKLSVVLFAHLVVSFHPGTFLFFPLSSLLLESFLHLLLHLNPSLAELERNVILLKRVLNIGGQYCWQVSATDLGAAELELKTEFEQIVGQLVGNECEINDVCQSHIAMGISFQVEVIQKGGQEHLEAVLQMVITMSQQKETNVVLEESGVWYEHHRLGSVLVESQHQVRLFDNEEYHREPDESCRVQINSIVLQDLKDHLVQFVRDYIHQSLKQT